MLPDGLSFPTLMAFVAASGVLLITPGPTVLLVASHALTRGSRAALWSVAGVALGDATALAASLGGLGALLAASAALFSAVKLAGAAVLIGLGLGLLRHPPRDLASRAPVSSRLGACGGASGLSLARDAWLVTSLNPKSLLFFVAFVPQFMSKAAPLAPQAVTLGAVFVTMAALNALGYALLADRLGRVGCLERGLRLAGRAGGVGLIGAGVATIAIERP
ncbi:lysine transporter LysE [Pararhodospirillum oryzae]|uniref:Lysine transporter LysE n=1 Tax=Pararhodospirillum oryzae TaxID=478448 RepID=A0A512H5J2_9PROT|nr:lysine transporter LysE [Pararhodospirillum oryzae]